MTERAVGQVWRYVHFRRGGHFPDPTSDIRLVRPGRRPGDWVGIEVEPPEEWRRGVEWTLSREQFEDERYVLVKQVTPAGAEIPVPTRAQFMGDLAKATRRVKEAGGAEAPTRPRRGTTPTSPAGA